MASAAVYADETAPNRYSGVAAAFHWITALFVIFQIWLGFSMDGEAGPVEPTFSWHKTIGSLILLLVLARLTYRLSNPPPPMPADMPRWERLAATWNHRLFYLLLIGLPIGGYLAVSAFRQGQPMTLIGGIALPTIPGIPKSMGELFGGMHEAGAFLLIGLMALHVAGAIKHRFLKPDASAHRMPPL